LPGGEGVGGDVTIDAIDIALWAQLIVLWWESIVVLRWDIVIVRVCLLICILKHPIPVVANNESNAPGG
jgi:hypothetical protein